MHILENAKMQLNLFLSFPFGISHPMEIVQLYRYCLAVRTLVSLIKDC